MEQEFIELCIKGDKGGIMKYASKVGEKTMRLKVNEQSYEKGMTGLMYLSCGGKVELVKFILGYKPLINIKNYEGLTALTYACLGREREKKDNYKIAELLLKNGANPNIGNKTVTTPINYSCKIGNTKLFNLLMKYKPNLNLRSGYDNGCPLYYSYEQNNFNQFLFLLKNNANANFQFGFDQSTILMKACQDENLQIIKKLLKYNANTNLADHFGFTALQREKFSTHFEKAINSDTNTDTDTDIIKLLKSHNGIVVVNSLKNIVIELLVSKERKQILKLENLIGKKVTNNLMRIKSPKKNRSQTIQAFGLNKTKKRKKRKNY